MKFTTILSLTALIFVMRCGQETSTNALSAAMGLVAVTSPTADDSSSSSLTNGTFFAVNDDVKTLEDMKSDVQTIQTADPSTQATALGNPLSITSTNAACYGPTWRDDADGTTDRPSGDLGIVYNTASDTDTTACVAAQLNALLSGTPKLVNNFVKMQAIFLSAANNNGAALPTAGAAASDHTSLMPTISGLTITSATLQALTDSESNTTYLTTFGVTGNNSKTGTIQIYHTPLNTDNTNFRGLFKATLPYDSTTSFASHRGVSLVYNSTDGVFTYSMKTAANKTTDDTDFFGTDNQVDFSKSAFEEDAHWMIATFNQNSNLATAHYAWQAGSSDPASRTFSVHIPAGTAGSLTGTGYFGFGPVMSSLTDSNSPWQNEMRCNWVNNMSATVTKVQRQTMTQSSGIFGATTNNWNFAPDDDCTADFTVSNHGSLDTPDYLEGARDATPHALVDPPSTSDVPQVAAPTFTVPSS